MDAIIQSLLRAADETIAQVSRTGGDMFDGGARSVMDYVKDNPTAGATLGFAVVLWAWWMLTPRLHS